MLELAGLGVALALVLTLINLKVRLAYAMAAGAVITLLSLGKGPLYAGRLALGALTEWPTIQLLLVVALISLLGRAMKDFGLLGRMATSLTRLLQSARAGVVLVPGIIGCLAVPGGAILSAPMVDSLGDMVGLSADRRAAANIVFRHAWHFVFPFVPGLVLEAQLSGLSPATLIRTQFPFTIAILAAACLAFLWRPNALPTVTPPTDQPRPRAALEFLWTAAPLILALGLNLGLRVPLPVTLALGLGLTFGQAALEKKLTWRGARSVLLQGLDLPLLLLIAAIMVFKAGVEDMESMPRLVESLTARGMPIGVLLVGLPVVMGYVTGSHTSAMGLSFPLLLGFCPTAAARPIYAAILYTSAFVSYWLSPLHLCQVLTGQYFKVGLGRLYRLYPAVLGAVALVLAAMFLLMGRLG